MGVVLTAHVLKHKLLEMYATDMEYILVQYKLLIVDLVIAVFKISQFFTLVVCLYMLSE